LRLLVGPLRRWDYKAAQRADYFIANSTHIQADIKKYYGRDSVVIYPPVDTERFNAPSNTKREGFIVASRQVPQKKFDLAIQACNNLSLPLTVLGKGPEHKKLVAMGGETIKYVEQVSNADMAKYFAGAAGFIWPCFDDFGIVAVEAMAAGTPVVAYQAGGALDYVVPGKTGEFFQPQTAEALAKVLQDFNSNDYDSKNIKQAAANFSPEKFESNMKAFIEKLLSKPLPKTVK
jgi:glycosyltransferase involved in cell wall biosynthesis